MRTEVYKEIYRLAAIAPAGDFLELGARHGAATVCLGKGILDNKRSSRLLTVENGGDLGSSLCKYGSKEKNIHRLSDNLHYFGVDKVTDVYPVNINDFFRSLPMEQKFSLVLIDADGRLDRDFIFLYNRLEPGSIIIIDDYENKQDISRSTASNPLGKSYSTFLLVEYFLQNNLLIKEKLINTTIICRKPDNISSETKIDEMALKNIRHNLSNHQVY